MNFPIQWRSWILSCVKSAAASILINGSPTIPFKLHRGLRQGDPLSPFLFNLVVEALSLVFQKATHLGLWEGLEVSKGGTILTHLQYADDTVLFCPPNMEFLGNIKNTLILFELASGLKVNFHKSSLHGINIDSSWLQTAADYLMCKVGGLPFSYLGLPMGGNSSNISLWSPIISRIEKKLATWKGSLLSLAGRLTLIKASISSLPMYFMSLFPVPKGVIDKINKLQRQFLWCGGEKSSYMALAAWNLLELPKKMGGLGCGNLHHRNLSLLFKWIWRLLHEPEALWSKVISEKYKYYPHFSHYNRNVPLNGGPWKKICATIVKNPATRTMLASNIIRRVGNDFKTLFWFDIWLGNSPLKIVFPRLFLLSSNPYATVQDCGLWIESRWEWHLSWGRPLRPRDLDEWNDLQPLLDSVTLSTMDEDSYVWTPSKAGIFTVKSLSWELAKTSSAPLPHIADWGKLWKGLIPPRVEIFTWLAILGKINTKVKLASMGIISPDETSCILCQESRENVDHLLLHCTFTKKIWWWWLELWNLQWVFPSTIGEAFDQWGSFGPSPFFKKVWRAMFSIIIWSIWKERNSRIFHNISCSLTQVQDLILTRLSWWIKGWGTPFPYSCDEIIRNPHSLSWAEPRASTIITAAPCEKNWAPPPSNSYKWNVDASVSSTQAMSAIGGVLRNNHGHFLCLFSSPIPPIEINSAEVLAIFRATQISMSYDHLRNSTLIIESDSFNAIEWCNAELGGPWNLNFQLNFIRNARRQWLNISIIHKGRSSNVVADSLAKQGLVRDAEFLAWL